MNKQFKKVFSCLIALTGLLLLAVLWQESHNRERGVVEATLPHFELAEIDGLTIGKGGKQLVISKQKDIWQITNIGKNAAEGLVLGLLTALQETALGDPVTESAARLEAYGIADQQAITVTLTNGRHIVYQLLFGKRGRNGTVYIRLPGKPQVFRGINAPLHLLKLDELYWRDKQLFHFAPEQLSQVTGWVDGTSYTVTRDGSSFQIAGDNIDELFRLDGLRAHTLFRNLATLQAIGFNDQEAPDFTTPLLVFSLVSGDYSQQLLIGPANDQNQHQAVLQNGNDIYILSKSTVEQINRSAQLLRDLRLFNVQLDAVRAVRINNKERIALIRNQQNNFVLDGQTDSDFDSYTANQLVRRLVDLRASAYVSNNPERDFSNITESYSLLDGSSWHTVYIGPKTAGSSYLAKGDFPGIYGIAESNLRRFSSGLEMFHKPPLSNQGNINYEELQKLPPEIQNKILQQINR